MNTNIKFIIIILLLFVICLTYELTTKYDVEKVREKVREKFKTKHNAKIQYKFIFIKNKNYDIVYVKDLIKNNKKIYKIFNK